MQQELFDLLDEAYEELYGSVPLTDRQKSYYANKYLPFINPDLVKIAVDENDRMIGFLISMPSLSRAMQKARGRLFPFGFLYILRALKRFDRLDFYLAGVKKEHRNKGVDLVMVVDVFRDAMRLRREGGGVESRAGDEPQDPGGVEVRRDPAARSGAGSTARRSPTAS